MAYYRPKTHDYKEHEHVNVEVDGKLDCSVLPSRAQQEFAEEVDINTIVKRFGLTGQLPENVPMYFNADFTEVVDFQGAMDLVRAAQESFDAMPAHVRERFGNSAVKFVEFTSNADNFDEALKLGLIRPEVQEARAAKAEADRQAEVARAAAELVAKQKGTVSP